MKHRAFGPLLLVIFILSLSPIIGTRKAFALERFSDTFNDGDAQGWWLGYPVANPANMGNWRVEDGKLIQDTGYDGVVATVEDHQLTNQIVGTRLRVNGPSGGAGILLWFTDANNWVHVNVAPANNWLEVGQNINGDATSFHHPFPTLENDTWYNLKVIANSESGGLEVYLDGTYQFTHTVTTPNKIGQTGVITGNAGGSFDNFRLTVQ